MSRPLPAVASLPKHLFAPPPAPLPFTAPPVLLKRSVAARSVAAPGVTGTEPAFATRQRSKLWEFNQNLHCSIIGTCLSTGELRQVLTRLGLARADATDHHLHGTAVTLAARQDTAGRLLHKALDQRHRLVISQFSRARTEAELRSLWHDAVARGDIPGAYWATLTHPTTSPALVREAFGEVHMLSHLVGAANRADIRRLRALEQDQAELQDQLARQQRALHQAVLERDRRIQALEQSLLSRVCAAPAAADDDDPAGDALSRLVVALEKRLAAESNRRVAAEARLAQTRVDLETERGARQAAEQQTQAMTAELAALEASLMQTGAPVAGAEPRHDGTMLLYVGGRAAQIPHLRQVVEERGAHLLHHDGGIEHNTDLLAGLVSRADRVLFPVDCISHDAALAVKRLCRQSGRAFTPLRTASLACLIAALDPPPIG